MARLGGGVRFVDEFAPFFREPGDVVSGKYFIAGDVRGTYRDGRQLVIRF